MKHLLRKIPAVHELQKDRKFLSLMDQYGLDFQTMSNGIKMVIHEVRELIIAEAWDRAVPGTDEFMNELYKLVQTYFDDQYHYTLKKVINATGTILHTNLGRARLSERAIQHVMDIAQNYSNLEYNISEGTRGSRHSHIEELLKTITGAEAAMVVNNNAAAVYLVLSALAREKDVIVSRGQLVEIGGSFRISSIMEESGAKLVEVGTTNKTHLFDYERAITDQTAMMMKVHTSNFKTIGFTKSVASEELVQLARNNEDIIVYEDLGSGVLFDFQQYGIGDEPRVGHVIQNGVDLVSFSGDKLLGGPQAGLIVGKKELIDQLKSHQLARVVRVDKMTLAALEGTLLDYIRGMNGLKEIPTIRDMLWKQSELKTRVEQLFNKINLVPNRFNSMKVMESTSKVGGGTMPDVELPTYVLSLQHEELSAQQFAQKLRTEHNPSIIVRVQKDEILLDLRTVTDNEMDFLVEALTEMTQ